MLVKNRLVKGGYPGFAVNAMNWEHSRGDLTKGSFDLISVSNRWS